MPVQIVEGDLLDQPVEVIVNAWNRNIIPWWLLLPQGVSGAIKRRAGSAPFRELGWRPLPLGAVRKTSAGRLPFRAIYHVAGINLLWQATPESIRGSVRSAVSLAQEEHCHSLAFPVIGSGSGSFPEAAALEMMRDALATLERTGALQGLDVRVVLFRP